MAFGKAHPYRMSRNLIMRRAIWPGAKLSSVAINDIGWPMIRRNPIYVTLQLKCVSERNVLVELRIDRRVLGDGGRGDAGSASTTGTIVGRHTRALGYLALSQFDSRIEDNPTGNRARARPLGT